MARRLPKKSSTRSFSACARCSVAAKACLFECWVRRPCVCDAFDRWIDYANPTGTTIRTSAWRWTGSARRSMRIAAPQTPAAAVRPPSSLPAPPPPPRASCGRRGGAAAAVRAKRRAPVLACWVLLLTPWLNGWLCVWLWVRWGRAGDWGLTSRMGQTAVRFYLRDPLPSPMTAAPSSSIGASCSTSSASSFVCWAVSSRGAAVAGGAAASAPPAAATAGGPLTSAGDALASSIDSAADAGSGSGTGTAAGGSDIPSSCWCMWVEWMDGYGCCGDGVSAGSNAEGGATDQRMHRGCSKSHVPCSLIDCTTHKLEDNPAHYRQPNPQSSGALPSPKATP